MLDGDDGFDLDADLSLGTGLGSGLGGLGLGADGLPSINDILNVQLDKSNKRKSKLKKQDQAALWGDDGDLGDDDELKDIGALDVDLLPDPVDEDFVPTRSTERYAVICAGCDHQNSVRDLQKRFVCTKCNQGCCVPDDVQVEAADTLESPVVSDVAACQVCPDTGREMTFEDWRLRMLRFYAKYAPDRVPGRQVDRILRSWAGREDELWTKMVERYGAEPPEEEGAELLAAVLSNQLPPEDPLIVPEDKPEPRRRLTLAFAREKLAQRKRSPASPSEPPQATSSAKFVPRPVPAPKEPLSSTLSIALNGERLGCTIREKGDGTLCVIAIAEDTPAARSDLLCFQRIHSCNGEPVCLLKDLAALVKSSDSVDLVVSLDRRELRCAACDSTVVAADTSSCYTCRVCGMRSTVSKTEPSVLPCKPCPDTGRDMTFEEWRLRMLRFYAKHAPDRVPGRQVDQVLRSWAGREDDLWQRMSEKYGEEPSEAEGTELLAEVLSAAKPPEEADEPEPEDDTMNRSFLKSFIKRGKAQDKDKP